MTNDQPNCKLSLAITKPGNRTNRLTLEITQQQAQSLLDIIRQQYADEIANISSDRHVDPN